MVGNNKVSANQLFGKIASYSTIVQLKQNLGGFLDNLSPYAKEYSSTLDLVLDILSYRGYEPRRLVAEILESVIGDANVSAILENGYHGLINTSINSLESQLSVIESKTDNNSFIAKLEDSAKVTISTILTSFLSCSVSPFIPKYALDKYYKGGGSELGPINIPTYLLDFSHTLQVSPVSESGIYFYNTPTSYIAYYKRDDGTPVEDKSIIAGTKDKYADGYVEYKYTKVGIKTLTDEEKESAKKVVSVPSGVKVAKFEEPKPEKIVYVVRPALTAEGLYKTEDMNAFIWYVANRGDNYDDAGSMDSNAFYEYNKMAWDSRRINDRVKAQRRETPEDWNKWLTSRKNYTNASALTLSKADELYPVLQLEPSESYGHLEHIIATFPAQRYEKENGNTCTIYKFNADYLKSIKIFNWRTIIMNLLYELNGITAVPDVYYNLSLSDEIIDAKLSTLIINTIIADDKEVDDSFYSFSNEDYIAALKRMQIKKYGAKPYATASSTAIQNNPDAPLEVMNSTSKSASLNELKSTITRGVYAVAGNSGSTGIVKTELSYELALQSNFVYELIFAIVRPFVRALLSPQIMLLFCINLDVMGLINLSELGRGDMDLVSDFIFRKLAGIIKKLIIQVKDAIVIYLLELVRKEIKKLVDEVVILLLLEQMNDYIRLLKQIMECIRLFGIGKTLNGIDEVNYADIIPEAKKPGEIEL